MKKLLLAFSLLTTLNASYAFELSDRVLDGKDFASAYLVSWTTGVSGVVEPATMGTMSVLFLLAFLEVKIDLKTLIDAKDDALAYEASQGEVLGANLAAVVDIVKEQHPNANISVLEIAQGVTNL